MSVSRVSSKLSSSERGFSIIGDPMQSLWFYVENM